MFLTGLVSSLAAECSDAGLCRLGARPESSDDQGFGVEVRAGAAANQDLDYRNLTLGISWQHADSGFQVGADFTAVSVDGPAGSATGLGDTLVRVRQRLLDTGGTWSVLAGARLPTGDDNVNPGLPQAYQTGLGPADIQAGLAWSLASFDVFIGYGLAGEANDLEGTELERGDDAIASLAWQWPDGPLRPGLQVTAIQRLSESTVVTAGGGRTSVDGSDGLQVNIRPFLAWRLATGVELLASAAKPQRGRSSDVDGLSREWAIEVGLGVRF